MYYKYNIANSHELTIFAQMMLSRPLKIKNINKIQDLEQKYI
jgi:hypothetical protein